MTTPNFTKGRGRLVTDRYDFENHLEGQNPTGASNFRHKADQIDVLNPGSVYGSPSTVELALEDINGFINSTIAAGKGFASIPDGYDTYHTANGTVNFDNSIPSLDTFLNPLFIAIINSTPLPQGFERLKFGGVLLIRSGTYIIKNTVSIPPGITLLGEGYGTKIVNATSLDASVPNVPPQPKLIPTPAIIFKILTDTNRSSNDAAVDPNMFVFSRETRIMNMVISDNFVEPTTLGDTFYKLPQNKTSATALNPPALISQQLGSSLAVHNVIATGRVSFSSGTIVSVATGTLLAIDGYVADTETFCKFDNCFIDGFSVPFDLSASTSAQDFLEIKNCKVRAYGYFNGDSTDGYYNTIIKSKTQNMNIIGSYFDGNAVNITSLVWMIFSNTLPNYQDRSKVVISNNQVVIDKSSNVLNTTWFPIYFAPSFVQNILLPIYPGQLVRSLIYGNSFQNTFDLYVDGGDGAILQGIGSPNITTGQGALTINANTAGMTVNGQSTFNGNATINGNTFVNASQFMVANPGASLVVTPDVTTTYTLNGTSTLTANSGSILTYNAGTYTYNYGDMTFFTGSTTRFNNGGSLTFLSGAITNFNYGSNLYSAPGSTMQLDGYVTVNTYTTSTNYTCDTVTSNWSDYIIYVNSTTNSVTITLPPPSSGRIIIVKDSTGNALAKNITIATASSTEFGPIIISKSWGSMTFGSNGTSWFILDSMPSVY